MVDSYAKFATENLAVAARIESEWTKVVQLSRFGHVRKQKGPAVHANPLI